MAACRPQGAVALLAVAPSTVALANRPRDPQTTQERPQAVYPSIVHLIVFGLTWGRTDPGTRGLHGDAARGFLILCIASTLEASHALYAGSLSRTPRK